MDRESVRNQTGKTETTLGISEFSFNTFNSFNTGIAYKMLEGLEKQLEEEDIVSQ